MLESFIWPRTNIKLFIVSIYFYLGLISPQNDFPESLVLIQILFGKFKLRRSHGNHCWLTFYGLPSYFLMSTDVNLGLFWIGLTMFHVNLGVTFEGCSVLVCSGMHVFSLVDHLSDS